MSTETHRHRFSPRTRRALERTAARVADGKVRDSAILPEILAEQSSTARQLLVRLGVDPDQLLHTDEQHRGEPGG